MPSNEAKQKQEWRYWMAKIAAQASDKDAKQQLEGFIERTWVLSNVSSS